MKNNNVLSFNKTTVITAFCMGIACTNHAMAQPYGLDSAYQLALSYDAQIAQAQANYKADSETANTALSLLLPQVNAAVNYFVTEGQQNTSDVTSQDVSITLNQPIYNHAGWAGYKQAQMISDSAGLNLRKAQQDLILRVAESYLDVLLAQKTLQLSQTKLKADYTQFETAEASAELGLASQVDVLEAKSNYDLSKSDTISAENLLDISLEQLANIIGKSVAEIKNQGLKTLTADTKLPNISLNATQLTAQLKQHNLDVLLAKSVADQSREQIEVKRAGHYPDVNFQVQYSDNQYSGFDASANYKDSQSLRYGISLNMPLYSGGRTTSEVTAAKQSALSAQEAWRGGEQAALLNMRTQVKNLQQGEKLINALREAVKSNDAFVESAQEGYRVGLKSMLEVLTARTNQTVAQKNLMEAIHNQVLNHLRLEAVIGDLTYDDVVLYESLLKEVTS